MGNRNKWIFTSFLLILIALISIGGCGKDDKDTPLQFAVGGAPAELDFWAELIEDFENQTGIETELRRQPTDSDMRRQGLLTPLKAGQADPDVFLLDVAWIGQFAASGWLEGLDQYAQNGEIQVDAFVGSVIDTADTYKGTLTALPVYVDGGLLYYRKDLLEQAGYNQPPQTWEQLLEWSLKIQDEHRKTNPQFYGYVWQGSQYEGLICNWLEFAHSNQGGIQVGGDEVIINSRPNVEATSFMAGLIHEHRISPPNTFTEMKEEEVRRYFQNGNALFERNWAYAWPLHQREDSPIRGKIGVTALPHFEGGTSSSTLGGWHIAINTYSDKKEQALELLKFVTSYDVQKRLAMRLGWNPGRRDVYTDPEVLEKMPHLESLRDVFDNLAPRPNVPYYTLVSETLQQHLNQILSGRVEPTPGLEQAEKQITEIAQRYESP